MVRQSRNYLAGAISGTALIGMAVVAFVVLVSLGTLRDWPLAGLGGIGGSDDVAESSDTGAGGPDLAAPAAARTASAVTGPGEAVSGARGARRQRAADVGAGRSAPAPGATAGPVTGVPTRSAGATTDATAQAPTGTTGANGTTVTAAPSTSKQPGAGGGGSSQPGDGGGSSGTGTGGGGGSGSSTSETVSGTVNNVVNGLDQATGGVLGGAGVPQVAEEVVNGVVGPESTVGGTVDKVVETVKDTVGGLLGGKKP